MGWLALAIAPQYWWQRDAVTECHGSPVLDGAGISGEERSSTLPIGLRAVRHAFSSFPLLFALILKCHAGYTKET